MKIYLIKLRNIIGVLTIVLLSSCEEVIDIDLNSSNPVLVAEGVIDNESPAWIRLTYTIDYFETEEAKFESTASVVISDNAGHSETLEYVSEGLYQGSDLIGTLNDEYTITILNNGIEYEASTILFPPSEILSASFEENENLKPGQDESYTITINFKDDPLSNNYYLFKYWINGELETNSYYLVADEYYENTGVIEYSPFHLNFEMDDEVLIELYSIDEDTYIYYSELDDAEGGMMGGSSTPYNPESNFGSEVLGYFAAWSMVEYNTKVE